MFWLLRRLFWFGTGAGVGFGGAMWIRNRVRRAVARYVPDRVSAEVSTGARKLGAEAQRLTGDMRDAVSEGRTTMHQREAQLRAELFGRGRASVSRSETDAPSR